MESGGGGGGGGGMPVLCYWDFRGLAQPIRLLLEHTGTKFEDRRLSCGPAPAYDRSSWTSVKGDVGLDFPNLPYYVDGEHKVTQSNAILRYVARKHDLLGETEGERVRVDILAEQLMDFRNGLVRLCYNRNFEQLKSEYLCALMGKLAEFELFLGDRTWFAGDNLTFVDFVSYELLDQHRELEAAAVAKFPRLSRFLNRFERLPNIEAYIKSERFVRMPLNNKMAKFGG